MIDQSKTKIVGAFIIGFAIVAGAYTVKNFGKSPVPPPNYQNATVAEAPLRVQIEVKDSNTDGIEDWRDELVKSTPVTIKQTDETYVPPDTLTGQLGISFLERIITSEGYGSINKSKEQIIEDTAVQVSKVASDTIIDVKDVIISTDSSPEAIRLYANSHADAILGNSVPGIKNELLILKDVLNNQDENGIEALKTLTKVYLDTRNEVMNLPVPPQILKEHLDLINVYNALYKDIESMTKSIEDPVYSLMRLKRYQEDAEGLSLALQNMYRALEPYASAFERDDSAILFAAFSPKLQ